MWQWNAIEIVIALFLILLIAGEVSAYIYSPLQSISFGPNTGINEKDTTIGVFYNDGVLDFSNPVIYGMNSKTDEKKLSAPEPKKDKQNEGINKALEPKDKNTDEKKQTALEIKKDKKIDETRCPSCNGSISGYKINDTNGDGNWTPGETGVANWSIILDQKDGKHIRMDVVTDAAGYYIFNNLPAGEYKIKEENQKDWKATGDHKIEIELGEGEKSINNNFTNMLKKSQPIGKGSISGYKINDINGNGIWNEGEEKLPGWKIFLIGQAKNHKKNNDEDNEENDDENEGVEEALNHETIKPLWSVNLLRKGKGNIKLEIETDENGYYEFTNLPDGKYHVREQMKIDWVHTSSVVKHIEIEDGDIKSNVNFFNRNIRVTPPQPPVTTFAISGYKINGTFNVNTTLPNWKIILINMTSGTEINRTTNSNGFYSFTGLSNGTYNVTEEMQIGWENMSEAYRHIEINGSNVQDVNFTNNNLTANPPQSAAVSIVGSSSCGRNVNTNEKYSNVKQHEYSKEIDVYISKSTIAFYFKTLGIITQAGFTPKTNEGCISALGEILNGRPSQASSDVPYQDATYFNVWVGPWGYSESSKVENQYLIFKKSDVKDDEIVKLMMYRDGGWNEVKTEKLNEGTYKAFTQGFGSFAIVKTQAPTITTQPVVTDMPGENKGMEPVNLALIIGVFLVILIGVIYYLKIR